LPKFIIDRYPALQVSTPGVSSFYKSRRISNRLESTGPDSDMSPKPLKRIKSEPPIDRSKARSSILRRGRSFKQESSVNFASTSDHFPNSVEHLESIPQRFSRDPSIKSNNDSNFDEIEDNKNAVLKHILMFKQNTNIYIPCTIFLFWFIEWL
jgi:hypothetical protein